MPYYWFECNNCSIEVEVKRSLEDYLVPPTQEEVPDFDECSHQWRKIIRGVNFMSTERHVGKEEFAKDRSRQELIESHRIEKEMMNLPHDKRKEHQKEVKRLRSTKE